MENNNPIYIVIFVVLFASVFGYVIYAKHKRKSVAWTGTVIDKSVSETATTPTNNNQSGITIGSNQNAVNRSYSLRIKSELGEEFEWSVGEGFYASVQVGDKLTKQPGTETPTKMQA
jgi:hypothetical protein